MTAAALCVAGAPLALQGVRVIDFSHFIAGPLATMFLADLGAEVIKIEKPGQGDGSRGMGLPIQGFGKGTSEYQVAFNRGKQSVVLDLTNPAGANVARRLAAVSDIVVQNFRPGAAEKNGSPNPSATEPPMTASRRSQMAPSDASARPVSRPVRSTMACGARCGGRPVSSSMAAPLQ